MYTQYFKLGEPPFSIAPNPRYLYLSPQHREALAHLLYGIGVGGGFVALTGEVGTGKTTLCRCLLEQLPEDVDIALIFNPRLNSRELLASICDELRVSYPSGKTSFKQLIDALNHHLLDAHARGRRTIVLIDEAQNLSFEVLEQIRLLTNLETHQAKLLQIILVGQPELNQLLARPQLRQLAQRITARYHLSPLTRRETADYIRHRLAVAGTLETLFGRSAIAEIYRRSGGIPRLVNLICDRALLGAYTLGKTKVGRAIARKAADELLPSSVSRRFGFGLGVAVLVLGAGVAYIAKPPPTEVQLLPMPTSQPVVVPPMPQVKPVPELPKPPAAPAPIVEPVSPQQPFTERVTDAALNRKAAFARLLALWKVEVPANTEACAHITTQGLRCLAVHGNWLKLRSFNLPAVLELVLPDGGHRYATLMHSRAGKIELALGERGEWYPIADILPVWKGDAFLIWKPPVGAANTLSPGERGPAVSWLRQRLRAPVSSEGDDYFDAELERRLVAFQMERGLAPDGRAGPYTLVYLAADDPAIPKLEETPVTAE